MRGEWIEMNSPNAVAPVRVGLSPCGESGLKCLEDEDYMRNVIGLSPCGESGLK